MAPKKPVKSLRQLSIGFITLNMETFSYRDLDSLPVHPLEDMINPAINPYLSTFCTTRVGLTRKRNLAKYRLAWLKNKYTRLDQALLMVLRLKGKFLKRVNLSLVPSNAAVTTDLLNVIQGIPNVRVLTLPQCDDQSLSRIGDNCPFLEVLDIGDSMVTDYGISRLCLSKTRGAKIKNLILSYTNVTEDGVLTALKNLESLQMIKSLYVEDAFMQWYKTSSVFWLNFKKVPPLKLLEMAISHPLMATNDFLKFAIRLCPDLRRIRLMCFMDIDLTLLSAFELTDFSFTSLANFSVVIPMLKLIGSKLLRLELHSIRHVDLGMIGDLCPNLKELCLFSVTFVFIDENATHSEYDNYFNSLETVAISSGKSAQFSLVHLALLLANCPVLKHLKLERVDRLTDVMVQSMVEEMNPLSYLTSLTLRYCGNLTHRILCFLLECDNNLQLLKIEKCAKVTGEGVQVIRNLVKRENLFVDVAIIR